MAYRDLRRPIRPSRGFQRKEPLFQGRDDLEDLKLKKELIKMMSEAHLQEVKKYLPEDEAERQVIGWLDESPHKEEKEL